MPTRRALPTRRYGAHGRPPLTIPADGCVLHFHSEAADPGTAVGETGWGIRVVVVAPVCPSSAEGLAFEVSPLTGNLYPLRWCQRALAACDNDVDRARDYLNTKSDALASLEAAEIARAADGEARRTEADGAGAAHTLWRDPTGSTEVNLQTSEVYLHGRMVMPVPADIAKHRDFQVRRARFSMLPF